MDGKTEVAAGHVAGWDAETKANSRAGYWNRIQPQLGVLRGCLAGAVAVAVVTFAAFRLHLNLSTSGFLYLVTVVLIAVLWGFWEASVTSLIAVNCLNY